MTPQLAPPGSLQGSNLALALRCLPAKRRAAAAVFYRFCRAIDDIADSPIMRPEVKDAALAAWEHALDGGNGLPRELAEMIEHTGIDPAILAGIVKGCRQDVFPEPFRTLDDLRAYCWHVACEVGLASIRIFGCRDPASREYAIHLGYALQFTNIIRDVGEDAASGRVYLPEDLLKACGSGIEDVRNRNARCLPAARTLAIYAGQEFQRAREILPAIDRQALLPARIMAAIYQTLLKKILKHDSRILHQKVHLSRPHKAFILARVAIIGQ